MLLKVYSLINPICIIDCIENPDIAYMYYYGGKLANENAITHFLLLCSAKSVIWQ